MPAVYSAPLNPHFHDLNPLDAGIIQNSSGTIVTDKRFHGITLHYVLKGRGVLQIDSKIYPVRSGQAFWMYPDGNVSHTGAADDPWTMQWISFSGALSHEFAKLPHVFDLPKIVLDHMCDLSDVNIPPVVLQYRLTAELFLLYSVMLASTDRKPDLVQQIIDYIQINYSNKLSVQEMANEFGYARGYLSRVFKKRTGSTIQEYILDTRILAAKYYLFNNYPVKEAATLSGFKYSPNFSKLFTEYTGKTPTEFKEYVKRNTEAFLQEKE